MSAIQAQPLDRPRQPSIAPRFIRAKDAPAYLGMCRDEFNKTVRPHVREFPIGTRGVGFDRQVWPAGMWEWPDAPIACEAEAMASRQRLADAGIERHFEVWCESQSRGE